MTDRLRAFPLWLRLSYTILAITVVAVYLPYYGWKNFLWFSDIALIAMVPALWCRSRLITSMMVIGVLPYELYWVADFISGAHLGGISGYMFGIGQQYPFYIRAMSLFHLALPPVLIYAIHIVGYDRRALAAQTILSWLVLPLCYFFTDKAENTNWVFGPGFIQHQFSPLLYLGLFMILLPLLGYVPMHMLMKTIEYRRTKDLDRHRDRLLPAFLYLIRY